MLTVYCPVSLSTPTCVKCTGFSGAPIINFGDPSMLFINLEKPLFFLDRAPNMIGSTPDNRCLPLLSASLSGRGGVIFSIECPFGGPPAKLADCRSRGVTRRLIASPFELLKEDGRRECPDVG